MKDIAQAIANRKCVLFAGAGASRDAGLPDWVDLVKRLRDGLAQAGKLHTALLETVNTLVSRNEMLPLAVQLMVSSAGRKDVVQVLRTVLVEKMPSGTCEILRNLRLRGVVTTNYDRVVNAIVPPHAYILSNSLDDLKLVPTAVSYPGSFLLKLHGDIDNELGPEDPDIAQGGPFMVLSEGDYAALVQGQRGQRLALALHSVLQDNAVLFLGYSLRDPDIAWILRFLADHCQFAHGSWYVALKDDALPHLPNNVTPLQVLDSWDDLNTWLSTLSGVVKTTTAGKTIATNGQAYRHDSLLSQRPRAFEAVTRYLKDIASDNLVERVLTCALLEDLLQQDVLSLWNGLRERSPPLLTWARPGQQVLRA